MINLILVSGVLFPSQAVYRRASPNRLLVPVESELVLMTPNSQDFDEYERILHSENDFSIVKHFSNFINFHSYFNSYGNHTNHSDFFFFSRKWISTTPVLMVYSFSGLVKR